jgi:hypothetical protein
MNWLYRYAFRFSNNNNTRSNAGMLFVAGVIVIYWLTCTGKSSASLGVVYDNRRLWSDSDLCDWCSSSWGLIPTLWCGLTGWIAKWGMLIAIGYCFFARRDEVGRIWEGAVEKTLIDRGGVQDLPDQPPTRQTPGGTTAASGTTQRVRRRGFNSIGEYLRYDFISNLLSDLAAGLIFHRMPL